MYWKDVVVVNNVYTPQSKFNAPTIDAITLRSTYSPQDQADRETQRSDRVEL